MTFDRGRLSRCWLAATLAMCLCACDQTPQPAPHASNGRYLAKISIDPQARHLLLTDCGRSAGSFDGCDLLLLDLTNGHLARYVFSDIRLLEGGYSAGGDEIMLVVTPAPRGSTIDDAAARSQIAMIHPDGSGWRLLNVPGGRKSGPVLSPDEKHVAYWRRADFPTGEDVYEFDTDTGDTLFAGPFHFFEREDIAYLGPDRILIGAWGARDNAQNMTEYDKTNNRSQVYVLQRGTDKLPKPAFQEVAGATWPAKDAADNTYFMGERPSTSFFRRSPDGLMTQWVAPAGSMGNGERYVAVASNGKAVAYLFDPSSSPFNIDHTRSPLVGLLNTDNGTWRTIKVPPTISATPIIVHP